MGFKNNLRFDSAADVCLYRNIDHPNDTYDDDGGICIHTTHRM